ncbi:MAG: glycerol-3-phosphate 1-O-acyltransferase PlsY [Mycoplasmataceae bacterium]|nr:glycerol-3-phosphate 1-O-acyltransferase PlsY [Mycoplasmataceae bacterium]
MNMSNMIWANIIWAIIGYLIGSINFSILITSRSKNKEHIGNLGSGNPGATNALRNYGWKFGLLIFLLDVSKSYWFTFIGLTLLRWVPFFDQLYVQAISLFVILGHIFPIFFKFKGGKGAATNLGLISSISLILSMIGFIIFFVIILTTKFVSAGSFICPLILAPLTFIPELNGWHDSFLNGTNLDGSGSLYWLSFLSLMIASLMIIFSHRSNIKKILNGTETKMILIKKKIK